MRTKLTKDLLNRALFKIKQKEKYPHKIKHDEILTLGFWSLSPKMPSRYSKDNFPNVKKKDIKKHCLKESKNLKIIRNSLPERNK